MFSNKAGVKSTTVREGKMSMHPDVEVLIGVTPSNQDEWRFRWATYLPSLL